MTETKKNIVLITWRPALPSVYCENMVVLLLLKSSRVINKAAGYEI